MEFYTNSISFVHNTLTYSSIDVYDWDVLLESVIRVHYSPYLVRILCITVKYKLIQIILCVQDLIKRLNNSSEMSTVCIRLDDNLILNHTADTRNIFKIIFESNIYTHSTPIHVFSEFL